MTLLIPAEVAEEIRRAGEAGYPHEICGVLVGEEGEPRRVARAVPAPNRTEEDRKRRYFLDPLAYAKIEREADARDESVLGFYHTHPDHPALPSETDRQGAAPWPGFSFLILAVEKGKAVVWTSWRLDATNGLFVEEVVEAILAPSGR